MASFLNKTSGGKLISGGSLAPRSNRGNQSDSVIAYWFASGIAILDGFLDLFNRSNSASAIGNGASPDGAVWTATSGTWGISSNKAYTTTAAASYPVATFDAVSVKATVKATLPTTGGAGSGVSFWVTDSSNWWGAIADKTAYSAAPYTCPTNGNDNAAVPNNSTGNCTYNTTGGGPYPAVGGGPYGATGGGPYGYCTCPGGGTVFGCDCFVYYGNTYWTKISGGNYSVANAPYNYYTVNAPYNYYTANAPYNYTPTTYAGTPTAYQKHELKVIKNTAGTISTVQTTTVADSTTSQYMTYVQAAATADGVVVSGAVSSTPNTVVSGTSIAASTPVPATRHGMLYAPAVAADASGIDSFSYNAA